MPVRARCSKGMRIRAAATTATGGARVMCRGQRRQKRRPARVTRTKPMARARQDMWESSPSRAINPRPARSIRPSRNQRKPSSQRASAVRGTRTSGIN